jgi:hypothetical protein
VLTNKNSSGCYLQASHSTMHFNIISNLKNSKTCILSSPLRSYTFCQNQRSLYGNRGAASEFAWECHAKLIFLIYLKPETQDHMIIRPKLRAIQSTYPGEGPKQEAVLWGLWQPVSLQCGIVSWNFPLWWFLIGHSPLVFQTLLCKAPPSWNAPPKSFVQKWFCAHLSGKNVFTEKFK